VARRPRLAVTLGDPRGIGPEVVARALGEASLAADVVLVGPEDQLGGIPARSRLSVGEWGHDGGRGDDARATAAGLLSVRSIERAVLLARAGEVDAVVTGGGEARCTSPGILPGVTELPSPHRQHPRHDARPASCASCSSLPTLPCATCRSD
jgi:4-hydroxythreonine-4-phosphate dehydrogenase